VTSRNAIITRAAVVPWLAIARISPTSRG
jgi:hypothetical protein